MRKLFLLFILSIFYVSAYAQPAPGITLDGSVNNSTIDTCGVDFFDSGGHEEHC